LDGIPRRANVVERNCAACSGASTGIVAPRTKTAVTPQHRL